MGVHGMDPRSGFTTPNVLEADTDRALVAAGRGSSSCADSSKWGVIGISSIARLDEADTLVTDYGLSGRGTGDRRGRGPRAADRSGAVASGPLGAARRPDPDGARRPPPGRAGTLTAGSRTTPDGPAARTTGASVDALATRAAPSLQPAARRMGPRLGRSDPPAVARPARGAAGDARPGLRPGPATCARAIAGPTATSTRTTPRPSSSRTTSRRSGRTSRAGVVDDGPAARGGRAGHLPGHLLRPPPRPDARRDVDGATSGASSISGRTRPPSSASATSGSRSSRTAAR